MPSNPKAAGKRYAKTPEAVLLALACEPTPEMLRKLKDLWMTWPDFPKRTKSGWPVEELVSWAQDNVSSIVAQAKLGKALERGDEFSKADLALLREGARSEVAAESTEGIPTEVAGMEGVANLLRNHFQVPVTKMDISDWSRGRRLGPGVPHFPVSKASSRWNALECINWFRKYKMQEAQESNTPDLFKRLENARAVNELDQIAHETMLREAERGQWMRKTEVDGILAGLGRFARDTLYELFDDRVYRDVLARLERAGVPVDWRPVVMNELRAVNGELLAAYHEWVEQKVQEAEREKA